MSRTKTPPTPSPAPVAPAPATPVLADAAEVLTLAEAAAYLRVAEADVLALARSQGLPGRLIGSEWRFLKAAVQDWLRTPPPPSSKEALMSVAGIWKDDPDLEEMLQEIYKRRGRPLTEDRE